MDALDPILLARIQFTFTVSFHILFPAFIIGLASFLAVLEGLWLFTRREVFLRAFKYWLPIFAVAFATCDAGHGGDYGGLSREHGGK